MARQYFAVGFYAVNSTQKISHLSVGIYISRSSQDVARRATKAFMQTLTEADGWGSWDVTVKHIDSTAIAQVLQESQYYDSSGIHNLYTAAVVFHNQEQGGVVVALYYGLAFAEWQAREELLKALRKELPQPDQWYLAGIDIKKWDGAPRRRLRSEQECPHHHGHDDKAH